MKPKVSIIFGHYSEDDARDALARKALEAIYKYTSDPSVEIIISCNGFYGPWLRDYCNILVERPVDVEIGRTANYGIALAHSDIFFLMSNDVLLHDGALEQSVDLVQRYPQYLSTPFYPKVRKWHEGETVDGYHTNQRLGSNVVCMTRAQYEDIGPFDEVLVNFDFINYINRWIRKGYTVMMTKEILAEDMAPNVHSYPKLQEQHKFKKWTSRKTIYHPEELPKDALYEV